MLIIGITGGIGSGKSAVSERFKSLGITIIDADIVAREVVQSDTVALDKISQHFGTEVLHNDGSLNRAYLRSLIFASANEREWLEALLHPLIRHSIITQLNAATSPYAILTSPLLLETDQHQLCNQIVVVDVDVDIQIKRSCLRDGNSTEQIQKIIDAQMPRQKRLDKANYIIDNSGLQSALDKHISELHMQFLDESKIQNYSESLKK